MTDRLFLLGFMLMTWALGAMGADLLPVTRTVKPDKHADIPDISRQDLDEAYDFAEMDYKTRKLFEDNSPSSAIINPTSKSVEARHQRFLAYSQPTADLDFNATFFESGTKWLKMKYFLDSDKAEFGLKRFQIPEGSKWTNTIKQCKNLFATDSCNKNDPYRTMDGSCNNLGHPAWGKSHTCMGRIIQGVFNDGISEPRKAKSGFDLPNVRDISRKVHEALQTPDGSFTHMVMQFGQIITHDVTMGLMTRTVTNQSMINCCPLNLHAECFLRIPLPMNDQDFYTKHGQTCMNFVRGATCSPRCGFGPRQHSTQITAYADASMVYGSNDADMEYLRDNKDGLLRSQWRDEEEFLPSNDYPYTDQCSRPDEERRCFTAGDKRVNEQPGLSSMHNLFLRHHNNMVRRYKNNHPEYTNDQLFQLARRVLTAQYQNIIYKEFLPVLLGPAYVDYFGLKAGNPSVYDPRLEVTIFNEFMTGANRYGHVLIQNKLERGPDTNSSLNLDEVYLSSFVLMEGEFDSILKGLSHQPGKQFESHLVTAVTHTLYRQKDILFGMDLASLNIQRGRDQGTAGYTEYMKHCFNLDIRDFSDLALVMSKNNWENLKSVYDKVEDVDLFTGGVSEDRLTGAAVGPTFGCILGMQFFRLKFGDRFFYEHNNQAGSFTDAQMKELYSTSLASIICENTRSVSKIAPNVFLLGSETNKLTDCKNLQNFNYELFKIGSN